MIFSRRPDQFAKATTFKRLFYFAEIVFESMVVIDYQTCPEVLQIVLLKIWTPPPPPPQKKHSSKYRKAVRNKDDRSCPRPPFRLGFLPGKKLLPSQSAGTERLSYLQLLVQGQISRASMEINGGPPPQSGGQQKVSII